jgi:hypothetical protein
MISSRFMRVHAHKIVYFRTTLLIELCFLFLGYGRH